MNTGIAEINILGIILFVLLIFHGKTAVQEQNNHRFFYNVIFFIILTLAANTLQCFMKETTAQSAIWVHYFVIMVCSTSTALGGFYWFIFVFNEVQENPQCNSSSNLLFLLPLIIWTGVTLSSSFHHWIFYVDERNHYNQGDLYFLQNFMVYGYILASAMTSYARYRKENICEKRRIYLHLFIYSTIPLLGKALEMFFPWMRTTAPSIVISIVMLYLSMMKAEIFLDPLTKLYNRRQFQQHLLQHSNHIKSKNIFLIFFDINNFKRINDNFGHIEGDKALVIVAQILKNVFTDKNAFLARYGGDEFAVILSKDEKEIVACLDQVEHALFEVSQCLPYKLSLSVGYSIYGEDNATTIESLVQAADKKMYCDKQERKNNSYDLSSF
ncbi:GGDEF domain-containing protein [Anaerotignum sp. MB30-C6]|uniref:GGDEF domain-containing protein n=1 Tax=Anaerotignum sp. MB30-C6 TaxID=3070814 RepID=UPI0027DC2DFE|nr:GGDEF domain-containing protein [Anaerotignum sp. MB30-C6]WMI80332.1 GGDEF domain-containing protein [Anaerotignum sp. MB30-C6]